MNANRSVVFTRTPQLLPIAFTQECSMRIAALICSIIVTSATLAAGKPVVVRQTDDVVEIETDALKAQVRKRGYVSGIAAGTFVDKKTGAKDLGFGLHIMDFLLAPGWRDDSYGRGGPHGDIPKHYVEGPQICTQARKLEPEIIEGKDFVAIRLKHTFTQPAKGFKAGSTWEQTLVFQPGQRFILCGERITSANDVDNLFYRIDMPGHVKHKKGEADTFEQIYLSYRGLIPAKEFNDDFAPDKQFLYQRQNDKIPERFIRAYQVKLDGKPGPWLAGMTLDPAAVYEAWCHERSYICFIEELHGRKVKAGESFGAAYIVGWFDDVKEMEKTYDRKVTALLWKEGKIVRGVRVGVWQIFLAFYDPEGGVLSAQGEALRALGTRSARLD